MPRRELCGAGSLRAEGGALPAAAACCARPAAPPRCSRRSAPPSWYLGASILVSQVPGPKTGSKCAGTCARQGRRLQRGAGARLPGARGGGGGGRRRPREDPHPSPPPRAQPAAPAGPASGAAARTAGEGAGKMAAGRARGQMAAAAAGGDVSGGLEVPCLFGGFQICGNPPPRSKGVPPAGHGGGPFLPPPVGHGGGLFLPLVGHGGALGGVTKRGQAVAWGLLGAAAVKDVCSTHVCLCSMRVCLS